MRNDAERLLDILDAIPAMRRHPCDLASYEADEVLRFFLLKQVEIIGDHRRSSEIIGERRGRRGRHGVIAAVREADRDLAHWTTLFPFVHLARLQRRDAAATMAALLNSCGEFFGLNLSG